MQKQSKLKGIMAFALAIILIFALYYIYNKGDQGELIEYDVLITKINAGEVSKIESVGSNVRVLLKTTSITVEEFENGKKADFHATFQAGAITDLRAEVKNYNDNIATTEEQKISGNWLPAQANVLETIVPYLGLILFAVLAFLVIRSISSANNKSMSFGKTTAKTGIISKVRFSDIAGSDEEKQELKEIVDFLKQPKKYIDAGARIPKGVLLVGPPGTGKTLLAKAIAGESNVPFFSISGSDFVEMFVGVGASRVRDLFDQAKRNLPCIVFIDEIDAVGRQRGAGLGGGNDEREQTLNQLLVQMDGFETNEGIIIIAATNRPDVLDPALLRPGRFDRQIFVSLPDAIAREKILKVHSKNKKFASDVNLNDIARLTAGFSGADLENLLNEAAILAARDNRTTISRVDVNEGVNKVILGPQKKSRKVTERDRKITAYHEAGHTVLEKLLPNCDEVHEVSIVPRGMAGGYTMSRPDNDDNYATINKLNDMIASIMGGRIAEEIIFKDISTGASNDIKEATKIARKMVTEFGMSKSLGFINLGSSSEVFLGRDYQTQVQYSEKTASEIDNEVISILKHNYDRAKKLIEDNKDKLENLTQLLLEKETIYQEEVEQIMKGKSIKNIIRGMNRRAEKRNKVVEEERLKYKQEEENRLAKIRMQTIEALKREGIIVKVPVQEQKQEVNEQTTTEQKEKNKKEEGEDSDK